MSFTTLHGLAVLENPRVIPNTKTTVFDGQLFLPSTEPALIGSFRYFNENSLSFADVGCYSVDIRVSQPGRLSQFQVLINFRWHLRPRRSRSIPKP
jgi:hypothetical protein